MMRRLKNIKKNILKSIENKIRKRLKIIEIITKKKQRNITRSIENKIKKNFMKSDPKKFSVNVVFLLQDYIYKDIKELIDI